MKSNQKLSNWKKLVYFSILFSVVLLFSEGVSRAIFYVKEGFNPYYLTFGFVPDIEHHSLEGDGYTKFQPNTYMHQIVEDETYAMKINAQGFRGLRDFVEPKPINVFRIATFGASSTFGYYVRDKETYPYQLEQMIQDSYPEKKIETLNFGIPHARIENILAISKKELPKLKPDLITLYSGVNNSWHPKKPEEAGVHYKLKDWLYYHSVAWRIVHPIVKVAYFKIVTTTGIDAGGLPHLGLPILLNVQQVDTLRQNVRELFRANLEELKDLADELGSPLMVVTQNYTLVGEKYSSFYNRSFYNKGDKWRTYEQEVDFIEELLQENKGITAADVTKLVHREIMETSREFAREKNLMLVEGIEVLENDPLNMASSVHLTYKGNKLIAQAIHDKIIKEKVLFAKKREAEFISLSALKTN